MYLRQLLFTERTLWVVVQTSLQTLKTEGVTARSRHRLIEQPVSTNEHTHTIEAVT